MGLHRHVFRVWATLPQGANVHLGITSLPLLVVCPSGCSLQPNMGEQPPSLDSFQALQTFVLGGQDVSNERMAALMPSLEAGGPAPNELASCGALCYLGHGETVQVSRAACPCKFEGGQRLSWSLKETNKTEDAKFNCIPKSSAACCIGSLM